MVFVFGILGLLGTVILHAITCSVLNESLRRLDRFVEPTQFGFRAFIVSVVAVLLATKHCVDIALWALAFLWLNPSQFEGFEDAVYFSSVTYTALGYGDIVLDTKWRMLCGFEAINGLLLFGISTALLFLLFQRLWFEEHNAREAGKL